MSFNQLPNELLDDIFKRILIRKRIQMRLVSPRWCQLIEDTCHKMTTLKWNVTRLKLEFKENNLMSRLFPCVTDLTVISQLKYWDNVPHLLKQFSHVTSLELKGDYYEESFYDDIPEDEEDEVSDEDEDEDENDAQKVNSNSGDQSDDEVIVPNQILEAINSMSSLEHLTLNVVNLFNVPPLFDRKFIDMDQVLPQLQSLELNAKDDTLPYDEDNEVNEFKPLKVPFYVRAIELLGPNCHYLALNYIPYGNSEFFESFIKNPHFPDHLDFLELRSIEQEDDSDIFDMISHLKSLEELRLEFTGRVFLLSSKFKSLKNLINLTELRFESQNFGGNVVYSPDLIRMPRKNRSIKSVKILTWFDFDYQTEDDDDFSGELFCKTISAWFPNLEEIYIYTGREYLAELENNVHWFPRLTDHEFAVLY